MQLFKHTTKLGRHEVKTWVLVAGGVAIILAGGREAMSTAQRIRDNAQPIPRSGKYFWPLNPMKPVPDVGFLDRHYPAKYGLHTGVDLNGPFGRDTDLGQPIHSITDGRVVAVLRNVADSWGNIIIVFYPGPNIWVRYAHCQRVLVRVGQVVTAGQVIGTIGKGFNNRWDAHLHMDVILVELKDWTDWPMHDRERLLETYADPWAFLKQQERAGRMNQPPGWSREL